MTDYFYVTQPLCCACANGRVPFMLDVCASVGGLIEGSPCETIAQKSNILAVRKENRTAFDEQRAARAAKDQEALNNELRALENVPDLDEVLQSDAHATEGDDNTEGGGGGGGGRQHADDDVTEEAESSGEIELPDLTDVLGF